MKKQGFTLLELLIVIVIIGILASIGIPRYFDAIENARASEAKGTLGEIYKLSQAFYTVKGEYPAADANLNGKTLQVDLDNDGSYDMSMVVPDSNNFTYSCTPSVITATAKVGTKNSWQMSLEDGSITSF